MVVAHEGQDKKMRLDSAKRKKNGFLSGQDNKRSTTFRIFRNCPTLKYFYFSD
jgi:hypothetical protein